MKNFVEIKLLVAHQIVQCNLVLVWLRMWRQLIQWDLEITALSKSRLTVEQSFARALLRTVKATTLLGQ
jgi:hypothetical protein